VNVVEMAWRGTRHIRYLLAPRPALRRGVPLVRVRCDGCGALAAVVEDHSGHRMVLAEGRRRYTLARLDLVACPEHGQLTTGLGLLGPAMVRTVEKRRTVTVRATPVSMP
jgi:hypothetical protein